MDSIRESLDRLSDLTPEELTALQEQIATQFGSVSDSAGDTPTRESVDSMNELADAHEIVVAEQERRVAEAAELASEAEAAIARMKGGDGDGADAEGAGEDVTDFAEAKPQSTEDESAEDPAEEATETPEEEAAEDAQEPDGAEPVDPAGPADPTTDDGTQDPQDAEDPNDPNKNLKPFSNESDISSEAVVEAPAEAEASVVETAEVVPTEEPAATEFATEEVESITESSEDPVTASNTPNELEFEAPEDLRPAPKAVAPVVITAGADLPGITAGSEFSSISEVAQALLSRKHGMGRTSGGDGEQHTVATFSTSFPSERMLNANDIEGNRAKINAVVSPEAIVAAGGLTAPVETSYDIFELGETSVRPVRDALAVFGADRGGLRFMTPPVLADLEGAVSVWTMQDDIDASTPEAPNPVKPCLRVAAGVEVTVYTDAIPLCLTFGNLSSRAYPELVERHTQLGMVQHARFAETRLLTRIGALSTQVSAAAELGAARDIFVQIEQAAAAYRSRYRLDPNASLRVIFPEWFKNALRADLTKQLPGDGREGTFNLADAEINGWFNTRNINVSWHLDGETGQIFGAQADGALLGFPSNVIWYLFSEGTFLFLDGGTLDLGLVRDSTLNGTNDYKIFLETFEGVAKVGVESLRITSALAIKGSSSATTVVAG